MDSQYPGASSFRDRHGKVRWRFRRKGKTIALPGKPGEPDFDAAYQAALTGQTKPRAAIRPLPGACRPQSFGDAWRRVQRTPEWLAYEQSTRDMNIGVTENFLMSPVQAGEPELWRDQLLPDLRRRHLKTILAERAATPHRAKHTLTAIKRMIAVALDEEWIEIDPSYQLKCRPAYGGWKAWPYERLRQFEAFWAPSTTPRLVFALGLWLGNRRADIASARWDDRTSRIVQTSRGPRKVDGFLVNQGKGDKEIFVPITPMLEEILAVTVRRGQTVLSRLDGKAFSPLTLTNRMAKWTAAAGIPPGHTLHGLRKTLGKMAAEGGASTRQLMDLLGHDDIAHAELYSREASQALLATEGMDKVTALHRQLTG